MKEYTVRNKLNDNVSKAEYYKVIISEVRSERKLSEMGDHVGTFLTYEEAFEFVGFCMVNDIEEFGRPDVYQILHLGNWGTDYFSRGVG